MAERVRWVTKAEAARELAVSISTLDRKIRTGEVEVRREGRRVYVRMVGEYIPDEELLRRVIVREKELERSVRELERKLFVSVDRASELERERDEARESAATARGPYVKLEMEHRQEVADHKATKYVLNVISLIAFVLLVLLIGCIFLWWFVLR